MTFIEIKEEDNINEFLDIDKEFLKSDKKIIEKKFRDKSIYFTLSRKEINFIWFDGRNR